MWFDPVECQAAKLFLERGQVVEAARELLGGPQPEHKAVQGMRLAVLPKLVAQARQAADQQAHALAAELLDMAARCGELDSDARRLRDDVVRYLETARHEADWAADRAAHAQELANEGRWHTAMGVLQPLAEQSEHARRLQDWENDASRLQRYLNECREHLERDEHAAANRCWEKAAELSPRDAHVLQLREQLGQLAAHHKSANDSTSSWEPHASLPAASENQRDDGAVVLPLRRGTPFVLRGDTGVTALVVSRDDVVLGSGRHAVVDVPLSGGLHSRHVRLVRERGAWNVVNAYHDRNGGTWKVTIVRQGELIVLDHGASQSLQNDDVLRLGCEELRFTWPVRGSQTCVVSAVSRGTMTDSVTQVLLCGDELVIGLPREAAHLNAGELPVDRLNLTLRWDERGLVALPSGRWLNLDVSVTGEGDHRLSLSAKVPPAELLGGGVAGTRVRMSWEWELSPWA